MKVFVNLTALCFMFIACETKMNKMLQEEVTAAEQVSILEGKIIDLTHAFF